MSVYGFPWPEMLSCEKYPEDNDMCIKAINVEKQGKLARPMHGQSVALIVAHRLSRLLSATNERAFIDLVPITTEVEMGLAVRGLS